jgi:hypothetical protein
MEGGGARKKPRLDDEPKFKGMTCFAGGMFAHPALPKFLPYLFPEEGINANV